MAKFNSYVIKLGVHACAYECCARIKYDFTEYLLPPPALCPVSMFLLFARPARVPSCIVLFNARSIWCDGFLVVVGGREAIVNEREEESEFQL